MKKPKKLPEIEKMKVSAYDLLQQIYVAAEKMGKLREELARIETKIKALEKDDVVP